MVGGSWEDQGRGGGCREAPCNGDLRDRLVLPQRSQVSFRVARGPSGFTLESLPGNSGNLSCCLGEVKSPFKLRGRARECSGFMAGESGLSSHGRGNLKVFLELPQEVWVPSSCHRDLREPLMLSLGSQESFTSCEGPLRVPLYLVQSTRASSRVEAGTSGFLFSSDMEIGVPMEFQQGSQAT